MHYLDKIQAVHISPFYHKRPIEVGRGVSLGRFLREDRQSQEEEGRIRREILMVATKGPSKERF